MNQPVLVDTGPLVALLDRRDEYHVWAVEQLSGLRPPFLTCEAVIAEAFHLLRRLPEARKAELEGLRVVHSLWRSQLYHTPEPTMQQLDDWQSKGEAELPLVVTNSNGKKSMVLGNTAHYVKGLEPKDSYNLLNSLREFSTNEDYMYQHVWTVGDTVMWDNRTSLHKATPYEPSCGRMMHRTIIKGGDAWEASAF